MCELIRNWILGIAGAAMLTGIAVSLAPPGALGKTVRLACGLVMLTALLKPVITFDPAQLDLYAAEYEEEYTEYSSRLEKVNESLNKSYIEEAAAAYILDKATQLEIREVSVFVRAEKGKDGNWYPAYADISCGYNESLASYMADSLGITYEKQNWGTSDGN